MDAERLKTIVLEKRKGLLYAASDSDKEIKEAIASLSIKRLDSAIEKRAKINRRLEFLNEIFEEAE